mmetsp:Transcript_19134/g.58275  ORF Transcript_19134/g.58275 Transcript_19134/m.58275 type:complete len:239 (+) Transcript_19134:113-829(+)
MVVACTRSSCATACREAEDAEDAEGLPPTRARSSCGSLGKAGVNGVVIFVRPEVLHRCKNAGLLIQTVPSLETPRAASKQGHAGGGMLCSQPVLLHVYDICWLSSVLRMPFFHVGIEVCGTEVSFGETGIQLSWPGDFDPPLHRQTILLGRTSMGDEEVKDVLFDLQRKWDGKAYRLVGSNCQSFAIDFCERLGLTRNAIPQKYLRFAVLPWPASSPRRGEGCSLCRLGWATRKIVSL